MSRIYKTFACIPVISALLCVVFLVPCAVSCAATDADDLALPVRKESGSGANSSGSAKKTTDPQSESKSKSTKDVAKRHESDSVSTKSKKNTETESKSSSSAKKSSTQKVTASKSASKSSKASAESKQTAKSTKPATDDDDASAASLPVRKKRDSEVVSLVPNTYLEEEPTSDASDRSAERELPAPILQRNEVQNFPAQSASLPPPAAPQQKSGFLARLLGRGSRTSSTAGSPTPFNTDYATRAAGTVIPAMLTGMGWGGVDLPIGSEDQYRLATLPTDFRPTDLTLMPKEYSCYGNPIYLRHEAAVSMMRMFDDAARQGYPLRIFSGYRDYSHQQRLYQQAVKRHGVNQQGVARPGKSEHQLGTTADVTDGPRSVLTRAFADTPSGRWLAANCARYGWKMTVLRGNGPRSHADEPWHIRYLTTSNVNLASSGSQGKPQQRVSLVRGLGRLIGFGRTSQ